MERLLRIRFTVLALVVMTAAVAVNAQTSVQVAAEVPFSFYVGEKSLPAGSYRIAPMNTSGDAIRIFDLETATSAVRLTDSLQEQSGKARLVFRRYGNEYYLTKIWTGDRFGRQVRVSSRERKIRNEQTLSKADSTTKPYDLVEIVAKVR